MTSAQEKISGLSLWRATPSIEPLDGGMTNANFLVTESGCRYVVRLGEDIPFHHISREYELSASRAAHAAGISPAVVHDEPGVLVLDYIEGRTLTPEDLLDGPLRDRAIHLIRQAHREIPVKLQGSTPIFWVFHVLREYARLLSDGDSLHVSRIADFLKITAETEARSGPYDIVFGHNDLLAANFLDDGKRLWLIDWEYAGFNTPLFDLAGLASNNDFVEEMEKTMLESYFEAPLSDDLWARYQAMKVASLLREVMWSMVSELYSTLEFDYGQYTESCLERFETTYDSYKKDYL
ncbi:choline kinase family protein [Sneathiella sp.]|uniref:choline kinase family protein n=1 Tax=Sneathiella sp. TaxID=1964365 RepID=UPI002623EA4C|nr:choline kinase family protein [Sneathiella sp.]MDF2367976.1 phosphotransferase [Sneathiella sp.]